MTYGAEPPRFKTIGSAWWARATHRPRARPRRRRRAGVGWCERWRNQEARRCGAPAESAGPRRGSALRGPRPAGLSRAGSRRRRATTLRADVRNESHLHLSSDSARHHFLPSFTPLLRCRMQSYTVGGDFSPAPCFPSSSPIPDPFCISSTSHAQSRRVKRLLRHTTPNLIGFESKQRLYKRCRFGSAPVESPGRHSPSPSRSSSQNQTAAPATPLKATNRLLWGF